MENSAFANAAVKQVRLERVVVAASSFVGIQAHLVEITGSVFDGCRFDLATLSGLTVATPSAFLSCSLREADLASAEAPDCIFHDCELTGADMTSARLDGSDLRASTLADVRGLATVRGVTLSPDQLPSLLEGVCRDRRLEISDSEAGPTCGWREAPEC